MDYEGVREALGRLGTRGCVELFADGWQRFPEEDVAREIITVLQGKELFWLRHAGRGDDEAAANACLLRRTILAIAERSLSSGRAV